MEHRIPLVETNRVRGHLPSACIEAHFALIVSSECPVKQSDLPVDDSTMALIDPTIDQILMQETDEHTGHVTDLKFCNGAIDGKVCSRTTALIIPVRT